MRKVLVTTLAAGLLAAGAFFIPASATSTCPTGPTADADSVSVGTPIGCAEAGGSTTPSGYLVADGVADNPEPADGYIGVQGDATGVDVVACAEGDYAPGGTNNVTWSTDDPTAAPQLSGTACSVQS